MNLDIYDEFLIFKYKSVISGEHEEKIHVDQVRKTHSMILKEFLKDDDIQWLEFASSNMGFIRSYQKVYNIKVNKEE